MKRLIFILSLLSYGPVLAQDNASLQKDDRQWVLPSKDYAQTRYSRLNQINTANAGKLQVAWTFSVGSNHGQEAAPLVVDGVMYVVGAYPNELFALDATTGEMKWKYSPRVDPAAQGVACCDVVNRGASYDNGKIFYNTLDNHTVAVDAKTGKEVWATKLGEITKGQTMTMAPLAAHGKVFVGNSGGELGIHGWVTALDQDSGKIVWRAYSVGSDKDVKIGPRFHPFYPSARGKDLGMRTWPNGRWQSGGGPVWGWISYDPKTNMIFYGSGNPGPWNSNQREGDNKWTATIFARDADTGDAIWADQINPHDMYDYDEINESLLLDLPIGGKVRPVLVHPGRDGFMFVIDRQTGQIYSADKYDTQTSILSYDIKKGRPNYNPALKPLIGKNVRGICPASPGAKDWQPTAWSPRTRLLYIPHQHLCMDFQTSKATYIPGTPYVGATVNMYAGPGHYRGEFAAWDVTGRKKVWAIHEKFPVWTGTMVTAGDIAVYGTMDRWFKVVDARNGKLLYRFRAPSGFIGQPMTYQGKDGRQYIAMLSGVGGWAGALANAEIDPRVRNGALGYTGAVNDLPGVTSGGSTLMVFALPRDVARVEGAP
jgi:PQQ-dependent dehydrogenase (methanol/ethanol family)